MAEFEKSRKTDWISKAKGFGVLGVVAVHTIQRFSVSSHALSNTATAGLYCVQLFFVITAYLTFVSLDKNKPQLTMRNYLKYFGHKLVRLTPVLYTAVFWHILMNFPLLFGTRIEHNVHLWKNSFFAVTFFLTLTMRHPCIECVRA
ncbi:MAG: acyltransferase family protein [Bacteroidales bacterium]|nr:acyltransferase family protein [Bacteroidales bacterium]